MTVRLIGIGQLAAGDDGVGLDVVRAVAASGAPAFLEIHGLLDATRLVELCGAPVPVIVVDAVIGAPPGRVIELTPRELAARVPAMSSHGMRVANALTLAEILYANEPMPPIRIVAVTIERPRRWQIGLSDSVSAAVPIAAERVVELARLLERTARARSVEGGAPQPA